MSEARRRRRQEDLEALTAQTTALMEKLEKELDSFPPIWDGDQLTPYGQAVTRLAFPMRDPEAVKRWTQWSQEKGSLDELVDLIRDRVRIGAWIINPENERRLAGELTTLAAIHGGIRQ